MPAVTEIDVSAVVFREDLYPRINTSATTVQKYAEDLDVLPEIEVNQHNELIDGWHRWTAHKKAEAKTIRAKVTKTASESEFLELAIERNAAHGLQLSQEDKKKMAVRIYNSITDRKERMAVKGRLTKILAVSAKLLDAWLSRSEKDMKEAAKREAFDLWLACRTQDEIAEAVGWPKQSVNRWLSGLSQNPEIGETVQTQDSEKESPFKLSKTENAVAEHSTDFDPPIYNIWKQQTKSEGASHFGNSEVRWVDNLLYLYTKPFDVVVDPFAGGGSTIDICKKRFRRYFVSDRKPVVERAHEIRQHDLTDGLPKPPQWKDVKLVYLDPPYWKQAEGQYSKDKTDLANMTLEAFNESLSGIIKGFAGKVSEAFIALIIQPTQWKSPKREYTDHIADMLRLIKLPVEMRYSVPYESQQCNAQMVEWSKEQKQPLVLTREIIVWRV
jgi:dsDNA-binding SOS-regulon protein